MTGEPKNNATLLVSQRVLVVEDEFLIALDIERILESAGAKTIVVVNRVAEALAALGRDQFDLAVLDFKLNHGDVLPAAEILSASDVRFIFLTGAPAEVQQAQRMKNVPVVAKPFDSATLLAALSKAMER